MTRREQIARIVDGEAFRPGVPAEIRPGMAGSIVADIERRDRALAKADQIMGVEGAEITEAVHAWVREDLPLGAQMTAGFHIQKLVARLQALKGPTHD